MKTLFKNCFVVNVFLDELVQENVLVEDERIIGVGKQYLDSDADLAIDLEGKILCPGLIDGHIHIESTSLTPFEFSKVAIRHGTTTVVADPHEIANVCGVNGIKYMLEASKGLPLSVYFVLPSCVPATPFDESGATLKAKDLEPFYEDKRVLGLGEVMDFPGVIKKDPDLLKKILDAKERGLIVDGHAPLLSGKDLDAYLEEGIGSDHECPTFLEAKEKLSKGQYIMIREGSAAKNLESLIGLFDEPYNHRCLLVTDDCHAHDLLEVGEIDHIIRKATALGKNPLIAIRMATIQAATYFNIKEIGAIAPGYYANMIVLDDLPTFKIRDVYYKGKAYYQNEKSIAFEEPKVDESLLNETFHSFHMGEIHEEDFIVKEEKGKAVRVISIIKDSLMTEEEHIHLDFTKNNGVDITKGILKIADFERHNSTGHHFVGFIKGITLKEGAIASSLNHDSHNLTILGTNERDMAIASNYLREKEGGLVYVNKGKVIAFLPLQIGGVMSKEDAYTISEKEGELLESVYQAGVSRALSPFMLLAFLSLPVIPKLKLTTRGLVDVTKQCFVPLFVTE